MTPTLTTDQQAQGQRLLAAILAEPEADDLRLIYADFLEETGDDERAEYVRLEIEAFQVAANGCESCARRNSGPAGQTVGGCNRCTARLDRLLDLMAGTAGDLRRWAWFNSAFEDNRLLTDWRRGFVWRVRCPLAAWEQHGPALVSRHPVERVEVTDIEIRTDLDRNQRRYHYWNLPNNHPRTRDIQDEWVGLLAFLHRLPVRDSDTEEEERLAVSAACLAWARDEAGRLGLLP